MSLRIIKKASGNVQLLGAGRNEFYPASQHFRIASDGNTIEIMDRGIVASSFLFSDIVATQVEPSAEIAPPALVGDFLTLLDGSFFFDVSRGGGLIDGALILEAFTSYTFTATEDNLTIAGLDDVTTLYIDAAAPYNCTGLKPPTGNVRQLLQVVNISNNAIGLPRESIASSETWRFWGQGLSMQTLARESFFLQYDPEILTGRWRYF